MSAVDVAKASTFFFPVEPLAPETFVPPAGTPQAAPTLTPCSLMAASVVAARPSSVLGCTTVYWNGGDLNP
jgi:hypothetical protein